MAFLDIKGRLRRTWPFGWRILKELQRTNIGFMAGTVAYRAFISLFPLLVVLFIFVAIVGDESLANQVVTYTESFLPEQAQTLIRDAIAGQIQATGTSSISIVVLLWGALGLFRGLDTAFSEIYGTQQVNSIVEQIKDALVVFLVLIATITATVAAGTVFAGFPTVPFIGLLTPLLLVFGLTVAFLPMYYFFPDRDLTLREGLPGAIIASVGWAALHALFQVYITIAGENDAYGIVGGILIMLTWLYFGAFILLFGGVVNSVLIGRDD